MKLSYHQRGLLRLVLDQPHCIRLADLGHTRRRSYRSEAGRHFLGKDNRGFLYVKDAARDELGVDTCYLCMEDKLGEDLGTYAFPGDVRGGVACIDCIRAQKRIEAQAARARKRQQQR